MYFFWAVDAKKSHKIMLVMMAKMCVYVIFLGSSWVLLLGVQGAVVAVASTPRATQSSARLRRRGSLACLLAACRWESKK